MKPYYDHRGITIYNADSAELLDELAFDVVLTDPPYGIGLTEKTRSAKMSRHSGVSYCFDDTVEYVSSVCLPIVAGCIDQSKRTVLTPGHKAAFLYPRPDTMMCIYRPNGAGLEKWSLFNCFDLLLCYGEGPKRIGGTSNVFVSTESSEKNGHPCPKPIGLWKKILHTITEDTDTVFDPFMGSGVTLRAAKDLGLPAIGCDIDERFCEIAANMLAQEVFDWGK
jgi:site-specific DNA-methyltransferase (adenine-specific)